MNKPHVAALTMVTVAWMATVHPAVASPQASRIAANRPDPRQIPVPPIVGPMGRLPAVGELPERPDLPDVLVMNDGTRVTTRQQWETRRQEMRRILEYYAVGQMPPPPGNVRGRTVQSESVLDGHATYRLVHLTFGPREALGLDIGILTPTGGGPFPTILLAEAFPPPGADALPLHPQGPNQGRGEDVLLLVGPSPAPTAGTAGQPTRQRAPEAVTAQSLAMRHADVLRRGYALVVYNVTDCAEDTTLRNLDGSWAFRNTRFYPAYPGYDWGILAGWAWGASRIADYLEQDPAVDMTTVIITGASRRGKLAMIAAAFDDRLMGAPVVTGGGGVGAYRFAGPRGSESLDLMMKKYPNWFSPVLHGFWGHRERLPFDQHWFLALSAPRPFIALEGITDTISLPEAVRQSILGARPAYELFENGDRLGVHYAPHGHAFTADDWTALMDFFDKYARGKSVDRAFAHFPTEQQVDAALAEAAVKPAPRLFMAGDSTMADKPEDLPERGWGMVLPRYFKDRSVVRNHAVNGRSTKSFIDEGRWQAIVDQLRPDDVVVIQFGHNDEKQEDPKRYTDPATTFRDNLRRFVDDVRSKRAWPILATPVARRKFDATGTLIPTHGAYPDAIRAVASEAAVPLLDLERETSAWLRDIGPETSKRYFMWISPGAHPQLPGGKQDDTHFVEAGAARVAELAIDGMRALRLPITALLK
jgi:lysophospholipase L1-like esterase